MGFNTADQRKHTVRSRISIREQSALDTLRLQQATWPDEQIVRILTEDLAIEAYRLSEPLKREFGGHDQLGKFLAYWRAIRRGLVNGSNQAH